jgi:hypothetical protein
MPHGPLQVLIDSTGLQVYGAGQWLEAKHGARSRRTWRKLHLAVDAASGMIVAQTLTDHDADDPPGGPAATTRHRTWIRRRTLATSGIWITICGMSGRKNSMMSLLGCGIAGKTTQPSAT